MMTDNSQRPLMTINVSTPSNLILIINTLRQHYQHHHQIYRASWLLRTGIEDHIGSDDDDATMVQFLDVDMTWKAGGLVPN